MPKKPKPKPKPPERGSGLRGLPTYNAGFEAAKHGVSLSACPYGPSNPHCRVWMLGYADGTKAPKEV